MISKFRGEKHDLFASKKSCRFDEKKFLAREMPAQFKNKTTAETGFITLFQGTPWKSDSLLYPFKLYVQFVFKSE